MNELKQIITEKEIQLTKDNPIPNFENSLKGLMAKTEFYKKFIDKATILFKEIDKEYGINKEQELIIAREFKNSIEKMRNKLSL